MWLSGMKLNPPLEVNQKGEPDIPQRCSWHGAQMLHVGEMRLATRIKEHYTTKIQPQGHAWMNFKTMKAELRGEKGGDGSKRWQDNHDLEIY